MVKWPVGSVCSAAGGMDLGFERAGMSTRWVCEVDPFRRKLLAKHFPAARQYPDLTTLDPAELEPVRVLIGGTPCQDFSVAGKGAGLDGSRSSLFYHYMRVRNALNVEWAVWENVLGAFSTNKGLDFARVLGAFVGAAVDVPSGGWPRAGVVTGPFGGAVWRVLNAQHFGVPQRRRRVFVVGHLGGPCPPEVLFEPAGGSGNFEASDEAREDSPATFGVRTSGTLGAHATGGSDPTDFERMGAYVRVSHALTTSAQRYGDGSEETFVVGGQRVGEPARRACRERDGASIGEGGWETGTGLLGGSDRLDGEASDAHGAGAPDGLAGRLDGALSCAYDPPPDGRRDAATGDGVVAPVATWIARRLMRYGE